MPLSAAQTAKILDLIDKHYPGVATSLQHVDPFQLLAATVLSAQCTDERVNKTTPALFARFPDPATLAAAPLSELEALIRPTGFFRNKAKNLKAAAGMIVADYNGRVPGTLEELVRLPGVARKTANVVLGDAFGQPGVVVDTHVKRLAGRIGWTKESDPVKIERELMGLWPKKKWTAASHQLIAHGRSLCQARRPRCGECFLASLCAQGKKEIS